MFHRRFAGPDWKRLRVQMLCVASHRFLSTVQKQKRPGSLRVWRRLNYRSVQVLSGFIWLHCSPTRCCQRRLCRHSRFHAAREQCRPVLRQNPPEAALNAGDNDGRVRFSRLSVVCSIQWAVTVLLHVKLCSSFCQHALWNSARWLRTDAKSSSTRVEKVHPSLILFEIFPDTKITS